MCRSSEATGCKSMGNSCRAGWERHSDSGNYNNRKREMATSCQVMVFVACNCQGLRSCISQLGSNSTNLLPGS